FQLDLVFREKGIQLFGGVEFIIRVARERDQVKKSLAIVIVEEKACLTILPGRPGRRQRHLEIAFRVPVSHPVRSHLDSVPFDSRVFDTLSRSSGIKMDTDGRGDNGPDPAPVEPAPYLPSMYGSASVSRREIQGSPKR